MIVRSEFLIRLFFILVLSTAGCSNSPEKQSWRAAIPADSPVIILHHDADLFDVLKNRNSNLLSEMATIDITSILAMQDSINTSLPTKGVALFPVGTHELQPVFILQSNSPSLKTIAEKFRKEFAINHYNFNDQIVHILHFENQQFFATQLQDWILLSKNSIAVENGIMTYYGQISGINLQDDEIIGADFLLNTPKFNNWIQQLGAPRFLPGFKNLFRGTGPATLSISNESIEDPLFDTALTGNIPLTRDTTSEFVSAFIQEPASFDLDRYIPVDAALFTVYHNKLSVLPGENISIVSDLDSMLISNTEIYKAIAGTLAPATAFAVFEASGFLSVGESTFIRRLENASAFTGLMDELVRDGYVEKRNNIFHVSSNVLSRLLGGPFSHFTDYYIMRSGDSAIITERDGLARRIDQDRNRRAVYYYNDNYIKARRRHPENVSAWVYTQSESLLGYLEPHLNPVNHAAFLGTLMDIGTASFVREGDRLAFQLDLYYTEERQEPVRELWEFPLNGTRLTGKPLLVNIVGGSREELIFATENNRVFGVASDGTGFLEVQTGNDRPIGSPIVYDWYGNNQYAILIAAGNKIYAWNARGIPLPNFPVRLDETITSPLVLEDVSRNGTPELIVATANRKVHVLDQRGRNIQGWPQDVNVQVVHQPVFRNFEGEPTLLLTAGNGLFGFTPGGERRDNFPVFIDSEFGPITLHENYILAGAADGHLYAIGRNPYFADSYIANATTTFDSGQTTGGLIVRSVYIGNAPIINAPIIRTLTISQPGNEGIREQMIGIQTLNGNLLLLSEEGQLRLTRNMGQNSADYDNIMITDLDGDGKQDIVGISSTGRINAWQIETGEQLIDLPATSIRYPVIADLYANGETELIGQTRDGLNCWSFRRP